MKAKLFIILVLGSLFGSAAMAQTILEKKISINVQQKSVYYTLAQMEKAGDFVFSYHSDLIPKDSLVNLNQTETSIKEVLEQLFKNRFTYLEDKRFLVIRAALKPLRIITTDITSDEKNYSVSGLVVDGASGERLMNASVYEKQELVSSITDEHGYFKLKFKTGNPNALTITASKLNYQDAAVNFLQSVSIDSRMQRNAYRYAESNSTGVERDPLAQFFLSARQKIQSLNIPDFFANRSFQVSLAPGLSTRGLMSSQVVNKFSLNLTGGYTAGVNGAEIAGLFNINRFNSGYLQLAGVFNLVGGTVKGLQLAGINNRALDTVKGLQVSAFANKAEGTVKGLQLAALNNEARKLQGIQIGLVNVADTSEGASIGLVNIIRNGFYKVGLSANQTLNTNVSLSTGTHQFYTIIHAGVNVNSGIRMKGMGIGVGHDFMFNDRVYLSAVLDYQIYGEQNFHQNWKLGKLLLTAQLSKNISLFAGPTFRKYTYGIPYDFAAAAADPAAYNENVMARGKPSKYAFGWEAGIAFNSVFKPKVPVRSSAFVSKFQRPSENWNIGLAAVSGLDIKSTNGVVGAEAFLERELRGNLAATFSVGYLQHLINSRTTFPELTPGMISMSYSDRNDYKSIPIKIGMKTYLSRRMFFAGELGAVIGLNNENYITYLVAGQPAMRIRTGKTLNAYTGGASIGYSFDNGLETSLKYEKYFGHDIQLMTIRAAYRFKLNK
ncbi:carboxypeptidase-like regulatory domain-containing protein [Pedobacter sp. MC2016-14]|uniref:carboxypeptidase-like regulatory domain-containing protein n=1 Tax=Pedobacter sp. MC2016-14 TaxID=2897327 RepID=UPI001E41D0B1|nr:carboxypeptidase-like regulatory domain-containing protein [Pedobacter sp. MC2016-14]MCD0489214.1 carboxypeptidase-like regulatory domain-containing protein [Pedobacter sp. MC2016-14]